MNPCTTASAIRKIDFDNKDNFLKVKDMFRGFATERCLSDLQKKDLTPKQQIAKFYNDSVEITKSIVLKILEFSPLGSVVVKYVGVLDPIKLSNDDCECFKRQLSHFMKLNILAPNHCDNALTQFLEFLQSESKSDLFRLKPFNKKEHRLDKLFFHCLGIQKYKDLSYVVKIILTLSHGQASVKRGFSINKSLVKVNMKEEAIVAKTIIRDYMLANSLKPHTVEISNKLILSCSTTHQKYHEHIEGAKKLTESNQREFEKQSLTNESNSNQKECDRLKETCQVLKRILLAW